MRRLARVVGVLVRVVRYARNRFAVCDSIATQFIGDDAIRYGLLALQQLTKEAFGRSSVATFLEQNVNDITILVDGAPQIISLAANGHEDFIKVPAVTLSRALPSKTPSVFGPEL